MLNKSVLKVCGGIILVGLIAPLFGWLAAQSKYGFQRGFVTALSADGLQLLIALICNIIPFAVFALIAGLILLDATKRNDKVSSPHLLGVIGAGMVVTGLDLLGHYLAWLDIGSPSHRGDPMEGLAFFFFPFYLTLGVLLLYGGGWLVGKWNEREMN